MRTLIEYCQPAASSRAISVLFQKLLSARKRPEPVALARSTRAISSSTRAARRGLPARSLAEENVQHVTGVRARGGSRGGGVAESRAPVRPTRHSAP